MKTLFCLIFFSMLTCSSNIYARAKIAWFTTASEEQPVNSFFDISRKFAVAAAEDFKVDLKIYYGENDNAKLLSLAENALSNAKDKPLFAMFGLGGGFGNDLLDIAEKYNVKVLAFDELTDKDEKSKKPRREMKHFLGILSNNDEASGYVLAKELAELCRSKGLVKNDSVDMIAIEGASGSMRSKLMVKGMKRFDEEHSNIINHRVYDGNWSSKYGGYAYDNSKARYPEAHAIWTAGEEMAQGVIKTATRRKYKSNKDYITGGVGMQPESLALIESGDMGVCLAGDYLNAALSIVVLYDYYNGYDFALNGEPVVNIELYPVTEMNVYSFSNFEHQLNQQNIRDRVNFKKCSKTYNFKLKGYADCIKNIMSNL